MLGSIAISKTLAHQLCSIADLKSLLYSWDAFIVAILLTGKMNAGDDGFNYNLYYILIFWHILWCAGDGHCRWFHNPKRWDTLLYWQYRYYWSHQLAKYHQDWQALPASEVTPFDCEQKCVQAWSLLLNLEQAYPNLLKAVARRSHKQHTCCSAFTSVFSTSMPQLRRAVVNSCPTKTTHTCPRRRRWRLAVK